MSPKPCPDPLEINLYKNFHGIHYKASYSKQGREGKRKIRLDSKKTAKNSYLEAFSEFLGIIAIDKHGHFCLIYK